MTTRIRGSGNLVSHSMRENRPRDRLAQAPVAGSWPPPLLTSLDVLIIF